MNNPTIYTNPTRTQYYLIPTGQTLPAGDFIILSLTGQEQAVEKAALAAFEISQTEANRHITGGVERSLRQVKNAFVDFLALASQQAKKQKAIREAQPPRPPSELVTSLVGSSPAELRQNPELVQEKLAHIFSNVKAVLEGSASNDPAQQEIAREHMRTLRAKLEEHGIETNEQMEQIPDKLRAKYFSKDQKQRLRHSAAELEKFAAQVDQVAQSLEQGLRQEVARLKQQAKEIETAKEAKQ